MSANYVTFKKFPDAPSARGLQQFLIDNGIECLYKDTSSSLDSNFSGYLLKEYEVQLKPSDFEAADKLLETKAINLIKSLPEDYYLLSFNDEELHDVILKHDEWSEFDYVLARQLLAERNRPIDEATIKQLREKRIKELAKPEENQKTWVTIGYLLAVTGGFFGIITGYVLWSAQKTLPNGETVYTYTPSDRAHGKMILFLGLVVLLVSAILWVFNEGR